MVRSSRFLSAVAYGTISLPEMPGRRAGWRAVVAGGDMMVNDDVDSSGIEDQAQRELHAVDVWDDGERDVARIAGTVGLDVSDVRKTLIARGLTTFEGDDV